MTLPWLPRRKRADSPTSEERYAALAHSNTPAGGRHRAQERKTPR